MKPAKVPGLLNLQTEIFNALNDSKIAAAYDEAPDEAPEPYISIGDSDIADDDSKNCCGDEITEDIHVWSKAKGFRECKMIVQKIISLFSTVNLSNSAYQIALIKKETSFSREYDGTVRHGLVRLTFKVYQED
ncbi:MAG: DUF3168 domain-containing protein [Candidatus Riflebacteria bacterium]|nr:DUF3168 domain-containing protein [Candidatus Riflebacteria bacterium]